MEKRIVAASDAEKKSVDELYSLLEVGKEGLAKGGEAEARLALYGKNAIEEKKKNPILQFLRYFWGPIPWMIEIAAILSLVVEDMADFTIIMILLLFNSVIGFWEEFQAGNAVEALKKKLASQCRVYRSGEWISISATELVPGDRIRIRLGDILPADVKLIEGDYLTVDQAALTGESLPVIKKGGDIAYGGSVAQQGEMIALVISTGIHTYFGKTTELVQSAESTSHFQQAVMQIGRYLIYMSLMLVTILVIVQLDRGDSILQLAQFALILTVASIPVAMPAVLSVTMAAGALAMARMKAIVTRLDSIEEMAGMDILCSDKTGTLTMNQLALGAPVAFGRVTNEEVVFHGALASKAEDQDPIDLAVMAGLPSSSDYASYKQEQFTPFDPVNKRTAAMVTTPKGRALYATKGAVQVILSLCHLDAKTEGDVEETVKGFATKGYRTLGVARSSDGKQWEFLGLLPLSDPLRPDSKETIERAQEHGIHVKMVTGDNIAIAKEISGQLGLAGNIYPADDLIQTTEKGTHLAKNAVEKINDAAGFAQVFPEHKFGIVKALQEHGHIAGMTGDGVNDAPALKQANIGIAVSGATDAARAAASLVLTAPGLSVIIQAVEQARRIFERMNSYAIYRICETLRIMFFIVLTMLAYNFYPITAIMIILLALLNDLPIMTIAYDNTWLDPNPVRWNMRRVLTVATALGFVGVIETFGLFIYAKSFVGIAGEQLQSLIFLKLAVAGHMTLFVARTKKSFFLQPYPSPILLTAIVITQAFAAMVVGFGWFVAAIPWAWIGWIWLYCIVWIFIEDAMKLAIYHRFR